MRASRLRALLLLALTLCVCRAVSAHETVALFRSEIVPEARLLSAHHETDGVSFLEAGAETFVSLRSLESARQVINAVAPSADTIIKIGLPDNSTAQALEFAGTRCVCSLFTTSAGAEGIATSAGRTVVSGFCQSSPGLENSEDCVCGGMPIPCYSQQAKVSTFTFSSFVPGLCNAVSNGTSEGRCEGEPCPNFGIKEDVYTASRTFRTVNQSREECTIRVDRQGCTTPKSCDCKLGPWSDWSICDKQCGIGEMRRTRNILSPATNGGKCGEQVERLPCKNAECVQDCVVSDWSVWSGCSAACGEGLVYRHRIVLQTALNGGRPCPPLLQSKKCTGQDCPANVTCEFSAWSDWSNCSSNCGSPTKTRTRTLLAPTLPIGTPACAWCTACGVLKEAKPCNTAPCPVDCVVSPWSEFSACSAPCGGGAMTRTRNVLISPANNGKPCPRLYETLPCATQECSSDCKVGEWGQWSACGSGCGAGVQTRTRPVIQAAAGGGKACPKLKETRPCLNAPCNSQCQLSEWSTWSACSRSCGGGIRERSRSILRVPANVTDCGSLGEVMPCNTQPCPKDCAVTNWHASAYPHVGQKYFPIDGFEAQRMASSTVRNLRWRPHRISNATIPKPRDRSRQTWARKWLEEDKTLRALFNTSNKQELMDMFGWRGGWSECSEQCGQGWMTRERHVLTKQWHGGQTCPALVENKPCSMLPCPSDCVVSPWSEWTPCSQVCGEGTQTRTRVILALPRHTGKYCPHLAETRSCAIRPCNPAVCPKSYWSTWSGCDKKCGGGHRNRTRLFANQPAPGTFSGLYECGNLTDLAPCNTKPCPIDCQVTDWSDWSQCSQVCNGGIKYRTRAVTVPNSHGGRPCPRSLLEVRACQTLPCPVACKVSAWSSWSDCSAPCGDGVQYRSREVEQPSLFGGPKCPPLLESRNCRSKPCPEACEYSQWSNWTQCSVSCGTGGIQTRARSVLSKPNSTSSAANPAICGETVQSLPCNTFQCPTDCKVGEWTKYKGCNSKCDGTKSKSRPIIQPDVNGGRPCPAIKRTKACSRKKCETTTYKLQHPVNCEYHEPGPWGPCMADCNAIVSGVRVRVTQAKGTSRDRGCQDVVEEQRCVMPDSVNKLRKTLKKELEDQLPPKEVTDAEGRKVKVNVKLDVQVTHQGRDGKICPLVSRLTIN